MIIKEENGDVICRIVNSINDSESHNEFGQPVDFFDLPGSPTEDHTGNHLAYHNEKQ